MQSLAASPLPRILIVDDEPDLLAGMIRRLRNDFDCTVACGGVEGIAALKDAGPFEVVVCDMRMPPPNGVEVLMYADANVPQTVRVLLTGGIDLESATVAINECNIFRLLNKPMAGDLMRRVLLDCVAQYRSVSDRHPSLEKGLQLTVAMLLDALTTASPEATEHAQRSVAILHGLLAQMRNAETWDIDTARVISALPHWRDNDAPMAAKLVRAAQAWESLEAVGLQGDAIVDELLKEADDYGLAVSAALLNLQEKTADG